MKNIPLQVNIEGMDERVDTDWIAIMATLQKRSVSPEGLVELYNELCAGIRVTTRGLTLSKSVPNMGLKGIIRESKSASGDHVGA